MNSCFRLFEDFILSIEPVAKEKPVTNIGKKDLISGSQLIAPQYKHGAVSPTQSGQIFQRKKQSSRFNTTMFNPLFEPEEIKDVPEVPKHKELENIIPQILLPAQIQDSKQKNVSKAAEENIISWKNSVELIILKLPFGKKLLDKTVTRRMQFLFQDNRLLVIALNCIHVFLI